MKPGDEDYDEKWCPFTFGRYAQADERELNEGCFPVGGRCTTRCAWCVEGDKCAIVVIAENLGKRAS